MKNLWTIFVPVLVAFLLLGCGAPGKKLTQLDQSNKDQLKQLTETMKRVDSNAALIQENNNALVDLEKRIGELEISIIESRSKESSGVQEIKENINFLNDQVLRLDNSVRTNRPVPRPKPASAFKPGGFEVKSSYNEALAEYEARRYESAISGFTEVLTVSPNSSLADNAQYWIGECYYAIGNFEKALESFNKIFDFPKSNKRADAHYKVAKTYIKLGNTDAAKEEFRSVIQNYPDTKAAEYAKAELGKLGE